MLPSSPPPTALITGAARRIGALLADHLAARGYQLVLHYHRSAAQAEALAHQLHTRYGTMVTLRQADLSAPEALADFWQQLPPCSVLIHNASQFARDTLATMTVDGLRSHLAVHVTSPLLLTQGFMAQLPAAASGNVIVLGDGTMGWSIAPQFFSYAVSKHAWHSVLDILAAACAPQVRVNMIALGPTLTGDVDGVDVFENLATRAPLARHNTPEEVLDAMDYLLGAAGVTGQTISLANGLGLASARPV